MAIPRHVARRHVAVLALVTLAVSFAIASAPPAAAGAANYVDPAGDVVENGTGAHLGSGAGDILAYTVDLDVATGGLTVAVVTAATAADTLPALVTPGLSSAQIAIDTSGDGQPEYIADSQVTGWVVYDERTAAVVCQPGPVGYYAQNEFSFWVPLGCIGSPNHVGIQVRLQVNNASDSAPDDYLPGTPGASSGPDVAPPDVPRVAVYRFWSPLYGNAHFFTASSIEAENVDFTGHFAWRFEGFAFSALPADGAACADGLPMYRFWSPVFSSHFYTLSATEKDHIVAVDRNWQYEGVAYCAYADQQPGTVPLYRFWSPNFGKHFFTADQAEADHIRAVDHNWQYEGIAAYVYPEA